MASAMSASSQTLRIRIAILNADTPVPNVRPQFETYGRMFHPLLQDAAYRIAPNVEIQSVDYDVVLGHYPESLHNFDAIIVTGSASSSYDKALWIEKLGQYLQNVYDHHPQIKLFGSCFGHQILCQTLLGEHGVRVEKDPQGWEVGVQTITLSDDFIHAFNSKKPSNATGLGATQFHGLPTPELQETLPNFPIPSRIRLQLVHADHVRVDPENPLPSSWIPLGTSDHCGFQGVCQVGRMLSFQGHFEFNKFVNSELIKVFGASWDEEVRRKALAQCDADDDSATAAELVLRFLLGEGTVPERSEPVQGVLTPHVTG